jgi:hypothetical protein
MTGRSRLERYEAGDEVAVWAELTALGPLVDDLPGAELADAREVAAATMHRVALNVATLVVRLSLMGYRFGYRHNRNQRRRAIEDLGLRDTMAEAGRNVDWVDAGDVEETVMGWQAPGEEVLAAITKLERRTGPLPLALRALLEHVDVVDLSGSFPEWNPSAYNFSGHGAPGDPPWPTFGVFSDPLNFHGVDAMADFVAADPALTSPTVAPFPRAVSVPVGANYLLSSNRAGDYHCVALPDREANPELQNVFGRPGIRLIEYLRVVFEWGGFPGFEFADDVPAEIEVLRRDLLTI